MEQSERELRKSWGWSVRYTLLAFVIIHGSLFQYGSTCPMPPPSPINSRLIDGKIVCDTGFQLFGDSAIPKCGGDDQWTDIPICATDISLNLPTNQSSFVKPSASSVDEHSMCSTTLKEASPWLKIDLLTPQLIYFLKIQFGQETSSSSDVEIRIGNSTVSQRNPLCAWEGVAKNTTYKCARPIIGQYVYVQMVGDGVLQVCDYSVYSTNDPTRCEPSTKAGEIVYYNNTCYEIVIGTYDYNQSSVQCKSRGGALMAGTYPVNLIKLKLENTKAKLKKQLFWIGVERDNTYTSRTWRSAKNGQVLQKLLWGKDQPNNYNGLQNCIVLDGLRDWNWNDVGCNINNNFICEFGVKSCSNPEKKELSFFKVEESYKVGHILEYQCVEGHFMKGTKNRECLENGRWSGDAPDCQYVSCGDTKKDLANGTVHYPNRTDFGATIKYECQGNYTLVGFHERRCKESGDWSGEEPSCLVSACPQPEQIINGTVTTNGLKPNSLATYKCNKGSILIGSDTLTCKLGGFWNPPIKPSCHYVQCGNLPTVKHGKLRPNGSEINDIATIICDEGYWISHGDDHFICNEEGDWKNGGTCDVITCQEPEVPLGAYIIGYELTVNSVITYHCDPGHLLRGQSSRSCLNSGEWSGSAPECTYIECGRVPTIPYGQLSYSPTTHTHLDTIVKYSCASNYRLRGDSQRVCEKNGHWSGTSPVCEEIRCQEPQLPPNAIISVTLNDRSASRSLITTNENTKQTFKLGSVLKFRCERGYKLVGHPIQTCIDGQWSTNGGRSSENPTCSFVDCGEPSPIKNGRYTLVSNTTYLNSAVIYECDGGHKLRSRSEKLVCNDDGKWGTDMKTERIDDMACDEISCPRLQSQNVIVTKYTPGGQAKYSCPRGYELIGPDMRICQQNGEWSEAEPNCRATPCPSPPDIPNSRIFHMNTSTPDNLHNTQVEYNCIAGFELIGNPVLTCYEASWTASPPECVVYEKKSSLPIVLGTCFGVILVLFFILALLYLKKTRYKSNNNSPEPSTTRKEHPMVMFEPSTVTTGGSTFEPHRQFEPHYYDNPNGEHIYEDLPCERDSVVTINGVAIS